MSNIDQNRRDNEGATSDYHLMRDEEQQRLHYPVNPNIRPPREELNQNTGYEIVMPNGVKVCGIVTAIACFTIFIIIMLVK
jgi:hypothetical protein